MELTFFRMAFSSTELVLNGGCEQGSKSQPCLRTYGYSGATVKILVNVIQNPKI